MMTTMKNPVYSMDSLTSMDHLRFEKTRSSPSLTSSSSSSSLPSFSSSSSGAAALPEVLPTTAIPRRRLQKRVRFASTLETVDENSILPSRERTSSSKRVVEPWRQQETLYGAYFDYLDKQKKFPKNETELRRLPPPMAPPPPEPGAEPPTYTHTLFIQTKSPDLVIDSITISSTSTHLPRIINRTKKPNKQQQQQQPLPLVDSYPTQYIKVSSPSRIVHPNRVPNLVNQKNHDTLVHAAIKRAEPTRPMTSGLNIKNKLTHSDHALGYNHTRTKNLPDINTKQSPSANNKMHHFSERSILPNYSKKQGLPSSNIPKYDKSNVKTYFFQHHGNDHLPPIIHSTH